MGAWWPYGLLLCAPLLFVLATAGGVAVDPGAAQRPTVPDPDPQLRALLAEALADTGTFVDRFDAEVWLVDLSGRLKSWVKDPRERLAILRAVRREATRTKLEPELVLAVITVESGFDRFAISRAGARGLMQIMPFWLREIGHPEANLFQIDTNLRMGCTILRYYLDRERGNWLRALARYNGSLGKTTFPEKVFRMRRQYWYRL